jgi:hypothetical protein
MNERIGQPAEHLPHWKQRRTELPDKASTFFTNPRFIVSWDRVILEFFTGTSRKGNGGEQAEGMSDFFSSAKN